MSDYSKSQTSTVRPNLSTAIWSVLTTPIPLPTFSRGSLVWGKLGIGKKNQRSQREPRKAKRIAIANRCRSSAVDQVVSLQGVVNRGAATTFSINNHDFVVDERTWTVGELSVGNSAKIKLRRVGSGTWRALMIEADGSQS